MTTTLLSEEEAKAYLAPLCPIFQSCYETALANMNMMLTVSPLNKKAKATLLHNLVNNEVYGRLGKNTDIKMSEAYNSLRLLINNVLVARFKKLNAKTEKPTNIKTKRNAAWVGQQLTFEFTTVGVTNIDIGYVFDETGSSFKSIKIICWHDNKLVWSIPIMGQADEGTQTTFIPDGTPPHTPTTPKITIKKAI